MALYDEFVPPLSHALGALSNVLGKAEAHAAARKIDPSVLLASRLYPDMFPLMRQVQIACDQARRGAVRLKGGEPDSVPDTETSLADLRARIASTVAALSAVKPADFDGAKDRTVSFKAGSRDLSFKGADYIRYWILPNFYFHVTTAYAILRHNGVELGKADFLGGLRHMVDAARDEVSLTGLADRFGSDKGSAKHRYTELYGMLFHPYRDRAIRFLEMGLQIGGPEHGAAADRDTTDLPSVRMWLDYFPKAEVHGLDVSDFSWFRHDRFTFHRCDMDRRADIAAAAAAMPEFDIVIDDASHASHHQQFAFLELFPRLKAGGLYVIEDLRWQPEAYEREGITKTAELFRGFSERRSFSHSDADLAAEFTAISGAISGCFLFQVHYDRRRRDQVAVIHKR